MKPITISSPIAAPPDQVFEAIVDIERLPATSPDTVSIVFVGEQRKGPGTKFIETRKMGKQTQEFPLELAECDEVSRTARFISEMHGTVWDTRMKVESEGRDSQVAFTMEAHTSSFFKRLVFTLMRGVFQKAMGKQVTALKRYCEGPR